MRDNTSLIPITFNDAGTGTLVSVWLSWRAWRPSDSAASTLVSACAYVEFGFDRMAIYDHEHEFHDSWMIDQRAIFDGLLIMQAFFVREIMSAVGDLLRR